MRYLISIVALLALSALLMPPATGQTQSDGVRRITPAEARAAALQGKAIIVDVRGEDSYNAGHIKGARWINLNDIGARASELPRDKMIITYCS
jgi:3-mercaptopyruvate sulfurtransferase SseA